MQKTITIYDDNDTAIAVTGEFTPACRGKRGPHGEQLEPDTEAELSILDAVNEAGDAHELTPKQIERAEWALWEAVAEQ